jgi:hypothetical protein
MHKLPESVVLNKKNHKILSPEGLVPFLGINKISKDSYMHLKFSNGKELKCSEDHPIMTIDGIVRAKNLTKKEEVHAEVGNCFVISKRKIKKKIDLYDIVNSGTKNLYYSNGIVSHNCEFLGSSNTLIAGTTLQRLIFKDWLSEHDNLKIYEYPFKGDDETTKDHLYCISVDVSEGRNLDASAFSIFDISSTPYKQVATYKNSGISPILFPTIIYNAAKLYNDAYIIIEINNNPQVADIIHQDLEYENLFKVITGNKKPQQLSAGFGRGVQMGVKMSPAIKRIGCSNLKTLIEGNKLVVTDFDTISELTTFVANKTSFAAEAEANDDLVMTLVIFGWVVTQKYFKDIVSHDIRKQIQLENMNQIDEITPPTLMVDDGLTGHSFNVLDGDVWEDANGGEVYAGFFRDMVRNM